MLKNERGNVLLKFIDRWVGIPLVLFLSLLKIKRRNPPVNPKRIGLLIPAAIGDTIVASPVFDALRAQYPNAQIIAFASSTNASIFPLLKGLTQTVILPIKNPLKAAQQLLSYEKFDWWIDFGQWARLNAIYTFVAPAQFKVGFQTPGQYRHFVYDRAIAHSATLHEIDNFKKLLSAFGDLVKGDQEFPQIHLDTKSEQKKQILIHMFAGGSQPHLKEWPLESWQKLIESLLQKNLNVVLTGVRENRKQAEALISLLEKSPFSKSDSAKVINSVGEWSLTKVAEEMIASRLVISVNTGVMHMAAALGCRVVSLQGPTSVKRWGPLGSEKNIQAIQSPRHCSPCLNLGFEYGCPYNNCMKDISVPSVLKSIDSLLN